MNSDTQFIVVRLSPAYVHFKVLSFIDYPCWLQMITAATMIDFESIKKRSNRAETWQEHSLPCVQASVKIS